MKKSLLTTLALTGILAVNAQTTLFSENFESTTGSSLPAGWTNSSLATDGGFITGTPTGAYPSPGLTSSSFSIDALTASTRSLGTNDDGCDCDKSNERVSTPVINLTGQSAVFMSFDVFYFQGSYNGFDETFKVQISTDGGTTYSDIATISGDATWNTQLFDISAQAANQANVKIAFWYDDGSDWLYGAAIDNVLLYAPAQRDMEGQVINMYSYTSNNTPYPVTGILRNLGGSAVTSMDLNYNVDNGTVVTQNLTGLNIAPLTTYNFTHGTNWTPTVVGQHTIKVWASNINGGADNNTLNDTVQFVTYTCSAAQQRMVLYEGFSSSTCAPCAAANPGLNTLLTANNQNMPGGKVAVVKYQMNYPSPGNDPCYTTSSNTRHTYYGVSGIPHGDLDGGWAWEGHPATLTQQDIDDAYMVPAPLSINATASYNGNAINVTGNVNSFANISTSSAVMVALVEDHITSTDGAHGVQSNGETDWHNVFRKFAPGSNGTAIASMTDGGTYPINVTATFTGYTGPGTGTAGASGNKIFTNIGAMTAIIWVQNLTTKEVLQASIADVVLTVNDPESPLSTLNVYPNPAKDITNIKFTLKETNPVVINIYNVMGELVYTQNYGTLAAGMNTVNFSNADLASGVYNVIINADNYNTSTKLIIQK